MPRAKFQSVAYLDGRRLLTQQEERDNYTHRLWDLTADAIGHYLGQPREYVLTTLFTPGAGPYLRRNGLWPDGEELPPPVDPGQVRSPHPLYSTPDDSGVGCSPFAFRPDGTAAVFVRQEWKKGAQGCRFFLRDADGAFHRLLDARGWFHDSRAAFSPDGRLAALSGVDARFVHVWDTRSLKEVGRLKQADAVRHLIFTAADRLAVSVGREVRVWDVTEGKVLLKLAPFRKQVQYAAVSPDLRLLAAGSREGQVGVWETATGTSLGLFDWGVGEVWDYGALAFSPDGSTAAVAGAKAAVIWDID
jgi:hypothetical protein